MRCEECGDEFESERNRKIHITKMHSKNYSTKIIDELKKYTKTNAILLYILEKRVVRCDDFKKLLKKTDAKDASGYLKRLMLKNLVKKKLTRGGAVEIPEKYQADVNFIIECYLEYAKVNGLYCRGFKVMNLDQEENFGFCNIFSQILGIEPDPLKIQTILKTMGYNNVRGEVESYVKRNITTNEQEDIRLALLSVLFPEPENFGKLIVVGNRTREEIERLSEYDVPERIRRLIIDKINEKQKKINERYRTLEFINIMEKMLFEQKKEYFQKIIDLQGKYFSNIEDIGKRGLKLFEECNGLLNEKEDIVNFHSKMKEMEKLFDELKKEDRKIEVTMTKFEREKRSEVMKKP
ncbi:MAG: hypothetical protein NTU57_00305 [Candidatus Aenigmarchaeota archaeon]|nr:hypothetical protein [Candidatus Aenigmarchaeota archaeon]